MLADEGHEVWVAHAGDTATALLLATAFDVAILDRRLPTADGMARVTLPFAGGARQGKML